MSKQLKVRILELEKYPFGKYKWLVYIAQEPNNIRRSTPNGIKISPLREILENTASGLWRFEHIQNYRRKRIYHKIYLTDRKDVALIKMCYPELLRKIYKIKLKSIEAFKT